MPEEKQAINELNKEQIFSMERMVARQVAFAMQESYASGIREKEGNVYTRKAIENFAEEAVICTADISRKDAKRMKSLYADVLSTIPPWQQEFVMKSRRPIIFGTEKAIDKLGGKGPGITTHGFFSLDKDLIYTSAHEATISHEKGHQFDYDVKEKGFFSDSSSAWNKALAREQATGWAGQITMPVDSLHINSRSISYHLAQDYRAEEFAAEAMAQMTAIYNNVYREYSKGLINGIDASGVDRNRERLEKTNAVMEKAYPELFPVYRDEFIPHLMQKTHELSKPADIEEKKESIKKIKQAAKFVGTLLPTNLDNVIIAIAAGAATFVSSKVSGEPIEEAIRTGGETMAEVSGASSAARSYKAGKNGDLKEASIQAIDALGVPVVAIREEIQAHNDIQAKKIPIDKALKFALPETIDDATSMERIIRDSKAKEMVKPYADTLSLKKQNENSTNNNVPLSAVEDKFDRIFTAAIEDSKLGPQILNELQKARAFIGALEQAKKEPAEASNFIPYGVVPQKPSGIAPG